MNAKRLVFLLILLVLADGLSAQRDTGTRRSDTATRKTDTATRRTDTSNRRRDTIKPVTRPVTTRPPVPKPKPLPAVQHDSAAIRDTMAIADTLRKDSAIVPKPPVEFKDTSSYYAYFQHPYIGFRKTPEYMVMKERAPQSKDTVFYLLAGLLFFMAFTRLLFPKYFHNTFRLFFQTSFRQKQTRDQLVQQSLSSLLLNLLFFFSSALYITLVLQYYELTIYPFWKLLSYCSMGLLALYVGKFLFLSFAGWVFNVKEGAQTYIFIVFLINKIIGVMLIPFIMVIAFSDSSLAEAAITASVILIALLFFYRYFVSLKSFRRDLHINPFHFFLYLCGVEIVPLLVIGKAVFNYIDGRF